MAEQQAQQQADSPINGGAIVATLIENIGSKRQRRPSVRLGEIGDQPATLSYDSHARRGKQFHDYKCKKDLTVAGKSSRTRALTNLGNAGEFQGTLDGENREENLDSVAIGSWRVNELKLKRISTKRVRSNWVSKVDEGVEGGDKLSGGENADDEYREFEAQGSDSLLKEASPNPSGDIIRHSCERFHGSEKADHYHGQRRHMKDAVETEGPSDMEVREWKCGTSVDRNENGGGRIRRPSEDGIRIWLQGLGLGRYAPVFEIHEVDDEVLPMLTLEDLKDMGINAVGSRRKMFSAIQKLGKGFS